MRFKIDVSDRETGEVGSVEVDAPTAQAARKHVRDAGYMVWATEPVASPDPSPEQLQQPSAVDDLQERLLAQAREGTFLAHPVRFLVGPLLRFTGGLFMYVSLLFAIFVDKGFPLPHGPALNARSLFWAGCVSWVVGWWIGRPVARGRRAQRTLADAEMVCRYCRRRGPVRTQRRGLFHKRLWGHCTNCGIRWTL